MRRETDYLADMLDAARRIERFLDNVSRAAFDADEIRQEAIVRMLGVIGDAAPRVSPQYRSGHPEIPWREIIAMRNIVIHEYHRVDWNEIWRVAATDVPEFARQIEPLLPPPPPEIDLKTSAVRAEDVGLIAIYEFAEARGTWVVRQVRRPGAVRRPWVHRRRRRWQSAARVPTAVGLG